MEVELIENYRKEFSEAFNAVMEKTGNNCEMTTFILESALDLAINDKLNEIYK